MAQRYMRDRYFEAMDAQFDLRRSRLETIDFVRSGFNLSPDQASVLYEEFLSRKRSKSRRNIALILLSGLVALIVINVLAAASDQVNISTRGSLLTIVPALFFTPFVVWAVLRTWRSTEQTVFEAVRTIAVYTLVIWTYILHLGVVFALFAIAVDFE